MTSGQEKPRRATAPSTGAAVRLAQQGDADGWSQLDEKIREEVRRVCRNHGIPRGWEEDDVHQIVAIEVFRTIHRFGHERGDNFRAWVRSISRQRLTDLARKLMARGRRDAEQIHASVLTHSRLHPEDDRLPRPSASARTLELEQAAREALERLAPRYREILELREVEGLDYAEIVERLASVDKESTARGLQRQARKQRQALMAKFCEAYGIR